MTTHTREREGHEIIAFPPEDTREHPSSHPTTRARDHPRGRGAAPDAFLRTRSSALLADPYPRRGPVVVK